LEGKIYRDRGLKNFLKRRNRDSEWRVRKSCEKKHGNTKLSGEKTKFSWGKKTRTRSGLQEKGKGKRRKLGGARGGAWAEKGATATVCEKAVKRKSLLIGRKEAKVNVQGCWPWGVKRTRGERAFSLRGIGKGEGASTQHGEK